MKRVETELCPKVEAAFGLLSKKWAGLIIFSLKRGGLRFGEIEEAIPGISGRLLSLRMRELELSGLVLRSVEEGPPIAVSYALTEKGRDLARILDELALWARM